MTRPPDGPPPPWRPDDDAGLAHRWRTQPTVPDPSPTACVDCGEETASDFCTPGTNGVYIVYDDVWEASGLGPLDGYLCVRCLEKRIGRRLCNEDFTDADINIDEGYDSPDLAERKSQDGWGFRLDHGGMD